MEFAQELVKLLNKEEDGLKRSVYEAYLLRLTGEGRASPRAAQTEALDTGSREHTPLFVWPGDPDERDVAQPSGTV
ncbi:MAG: hypothetical protein FJZ90_03475 [Chloroflexi bacterium]|nr:hypothetical protein [Chloroflexota bacterium]